MVRGKGARVSQYRVLVCLQWLLLAESSRSHPQIFAVASVRSSPEAATQMLVSGLN